jgi:signal peptidase II
VPLFLKILIPSLIIIDRLSKIYFFHILKDGSVIWLIKPWAGFILVLNQGAAFGLFQGQVYILGLVSLAVLTGLIYFYKHELHKTFFWYLSFGFLVSGAAGNLYDRLFQGYVIDFLYTSFWPTFNLADVFINMGIGGLIIFYFILYKK